MRVGSEGPDCLRLVRKRSCTARLFPEYLTLGYLSGDDTLFRGVKKLPPGHWLLWQDGELQINRYWDVPLPGGDRGDAEAKPS